MSGGRQLGGTEHNSAPVSGRNEADGNGRGAGGARERWQRPDVPAPAGHFSAAPSVSLLAGSPAKNRGAALARLAVADAGARGSGAQACFNVRRRDRPATQDGSWKRNVETVKISVLGRRLRWPTANRQTKVLGLHIYTAQDPSCPFLHGGRPENRAISFPCLLAFVSSFW
jgi:hypothetical protein